jgi:hypothetical protein
VDIKQDMQCTYNVTLRVVRESFLPRKSNSITYFYVCVRDFGWSCAWACACACVRVVLIIQYATSMRHIVTSFVAPMTPPHFSTLSHKRCDFWKKKVIEHKMCLLFFSTNFVESISHSKKNSATCSKSRNVFM